MYKKVKNQSNYTLRELLAQKGKIIVIGKSEKISFTFYGEERFIPVHPAYFIINEDGEIWDEEEQIFLTIDSNGVVTFNAGSSEPSKYSGIMEEMKKEGIDKILIQGNIVWIRKNGKYEKAMFYSQMNKALYNAETFDLIDTIIMVEEV